VSIGVGSRSRGSYCPHGDGDRLGMGLRCGLERSGPHGGNQGGQPVADQPEDLGQLLHKLRVFCGSDKTIQWLKYHQLYPGWEEGPNLSTLNPVRVAVFSILVPGLAPDELIAYGFEAPRNLQQPVKRDSLFTLKGVLQPLVSRVPAPLPFEEADYSRDMEFSIINAEFTALGAHGERNDHSACPLVIYPFPPPVSPLMHHHALCASSSPWTIMTPPAILSPSGLNAHAGPRGSKPS
jgi:hypothetical protein